MPLEFLVWDLRGTRHPDVASATKAASLQSVPSDELRRFYDELPRILEELAPEAQPAIAVDLYGPQIEIRVPWHAADRISAGLLSACESRNLTLVDVQGGNLAEHERELSERRDGGDSGGRPRVELEQPDPDLTAVQGFMSPPQPDPERETPVAKQRLQSSLRSRRVVERRTAAFEMTGWTRHADLVQAAIEAAQSDTDSLVRGLAAEALGIWGIRDSEGLILALAKDLVRLGGRDDDARLPALQAAYGVAHLALREDEPGYVRLVAELHELAEAADSTTSADLLRLIEAVGNARSRP